MKGSLRYWELASGGESSVTSDASVATATLTGLQCGLIDVRSATEFVILAGTSVLTSGAIDFTGTTVPTGIDTEPGLLWPGYGRLFTSISHSGGQITYYTKRDD